jgi:TPR repeat protein
MPATEPAPDLKVDQPYPGLRSFEPEEEHLFYGREAHVAQLLRRLSENRLLAVVGSSGTGKSSLVYAGLLPALHRGRLIGATSRWRVSVMRPGSAPLDNLAEALAEQGILSGDLEGVRREVGRSSLGLARATRSSNFEAGESLLLVVDQFEELFRFARERRAEDGGAEARLLVAALVETVELSTAPVYVVLTMRSDYIGDCTQFPGLPEALNRGQYLIPALTREQIRDAVEKPLRVAGARMSPQLVERLLTELGDDVSRLPVLQHALNRTFHQWKAAGAGRDITVDDYAAVGTLVGALDAHADGLLASLGDSQPWAEKVFRCLTSVEGGRKVRRPTRLDLIYKVVGAFDAESRAHVLAVIDRYSRRDDSLLVWSGKKHGAGSIVDISHECLITDWEKLGEWVETEAKAAEWYGSAAKDAVWKRRTWRDPEVSIALGFLEQGIWNEHWAARLPEAKVPLDVVMEFIQRGAAEQRQEKEGAEARRARKLDDARALAEAERRERENAQAAHALERQAREAAEMARAAEQKAREAADVNAAAQARVKRWFIAATIAATFLLLLAALSAAGYAWSRRQVVLAQEELYAAVTRELETRKKLDDLDSKLQKTALEEGAIREELQQPNPTQREDLQIRLAQLSQEMDQLNRQRTDAESRARAEVQARTQLEKQADVRKSAYVLALKRINDLETALKMAQDEAMSSAQALAELKAKNDDLQKRLSAGGLPVQAPAAGQAQGVNSYAGGSSGLPRDNRSVAQLRRATNAGDLNGMAALGLLYENGRGGLPKDDVRAVGLYRKAADGGEPLAMYRLGYMYENGRGGLPRDEPRAVELFRKAANAGFPEAITNLGFSYYYGRGGLPIDEAKAGELYRRAADAGEAMAMNNLGFMYANGRGGLPRNDAKAVELYRRAVDAENPLAMENLANQYERGTGGLKKDRAKAADLRGRAARIRSQQRN